MKKFHANGRFRTVMLVLVAILAAFLGASVVVAVTTRDYAGFVACVCALIVSVVIFLLLGTGRIYVSDTEIKIKMLRCKRTYKRSDLSEVFIQRTASTRYGGGNVFMTLCFYGFSGQLTAEISLYEYERRCNQNPKLKIHTVEVNEFLLKHCFTNFQEHAILYA